MCLSVRTSQVDVSSLSLFTSMDYWTIYEHQQVRQLTLTADLFFSTLLVSSFRYATLGRCSALVSFCDHEL